MSASSSSCSQSAKRLLDLSVEDRKRFLESFDFVFTGCDGVIWNLKNPIKGVGSTIGALKSQNKRLVYVSNHSVQTLAKFHSHVEYHLGGHKVDWVDLVYPVNSVLNYLKSIKFEGTIYAICSEPLLKGLRSAGYSVIHSLTYAQPQAPRAIKAVVIDADFDTSYNKLVQAEQYLKGDPECMLIAGATDHCRFVKPPFEVLGSEQIMDVLEKAAGRKATVLGKPGHQLAVQLMEQFGVENPRRVLFVGDKLVQTIVFGKVSGFQTLLVLTGHSEKEDMEELSYEPDYYTESFADFSKIIYGRQ